MKKCKICNKELLNSRSDKKFCSSKCYNKYYIKKFGKKMLKTKLIKFPSFYSDKYSKYKKNYKNYYLKNKIIINEKRALQLRDNWPKLTWQRLRATAKRNKEKFNIKIDDIIVPEYCPILNIKLKVGISFRYNSPSVDRIDNNKGYIKGNIQVISQSANAMKSDMPIKVWKEFIEGFKNVYKTNA